MSKIKPALTAEEWRHVAKAAVGDYNMAPMIHGVYAYYINDGAAPQLNRPEALAALCLHGQPFGFTWEDVDVIRAAHPLPGEPIQESYNPYAMWEIADRIAALLPPRAE